MDYSTFLDLKDQGLASIQTTDAGGSFIIIPMYDQHTGEQLPDAQYPITYSEVADRKKYFEAVIQQHTDRINIAKNTIEKETADCQTAQANVDAAVKILAELPPPVDDPGEISPPVITTP